MMGCDEFRIRLRTIAEKAIEEIAVNELARPSERISDLKILRFLIDEKLTALGEKQ